jgi:hypothetical protein
MLHVSISLTLAAISFSGGRQIATSGSSTPRGGLKQLLARTTPGHLPWHVASQPAPVAEVILASSSLPMDVPLGMAATRHGSTVPSAARTGAEHPPEQPPSPRRARPLTT